MAEFSADMPDEKVLAINDTLVTAWMVKNGVMEGPPPSVVAFSPEEAEIAARAMRDRGLGVTRTPENTTIHTCCVEPTVVRSLYAWALAEWADGRVR